MPKNVVKKKVPASTLTAFSEVFTNLAAGQPLSHSQVMDAMPVVGLVQAAMDAQQGIILEPAETADAENR